jgi:formylglycine-generating enzyme required for sulfatase activity
VALAAAIAASVTVTACGPERPAATPIISDLVGWDAATPEARRAAAVEIGTRLPEFVLMRMETFSCGGQTHEVGVFSHEATTLEFVLVPGGTFLMGSPPSEQGRSHDETQHEVTLTRPFLISRTACTQAAYEKVVGQTEFTFRGPRLPAVGISWTAARAFCDRARLELPTEARWEYACRAGTTTTWSFGADERLVGEFAWYYANSGTNVNQQVARKKPNAFGLYDVHGGVVEWCADSYEAFSSDSVTDPTGPARPASRRVVRAGGWNTPVGIRSATRGGLSEGQWLDLGFRPARTVPW